uniref:Ubiquitin-like domain-containing protein n=1 Tax=viral metagenome TaxID=1070528 RepID=A0A6C0KZR2_9ZZZZ
MSKYTFTISWRKPNTFTLYLEPETTVFQAKKALQRELGLPEGKPLQQFKFFTGNDQKPLANNSLMRNAPKQIRVTNPPMALALVEQSINPPKFYPLSQVQKNLPSRNQPIWNITLDFDRTCTEGHSGGTYQGRDPMTNKNKNRFVEEVKKWLDQGHNVVILTRGIDVRVLSYISGLPKLDPIDVILNDFQKGKLCIYAPDEQTFIAHTDEQWWAKEKVNYMDKFLEKSDIGINGTIFMDDTLVNVNTIQKAYSNMTCEPATPGDYESTFAKVNNTVKQMVGGRRTRRTSLRRGSLRRGSLRRRHTTRRQ